VQKQDKGCRMQSKVITYIKFATKDETKTNIMNRTSWILHSFRVMLALFTRRFKETLSFKGYGGGMKYL
jgi:hypothetical protein